jgi:4-hydroxybutyrate CoA-transferase
MRIGIKYCGGCNPRYDRTDLVSRLNKYIGEGHSVETAKQGIIYEIVAVLCGCTSACANYKDLEAKYEKICITSESDIIKVLNIIDKIKDL